MVDDADHSHADSNRIAGNEFVHNISVHQASMPKFSVISTFSVALPPNPTVAINESSRTSEAGSGCNLIRLPLSPCLAQGSPIRWLRHSVACSNVYATPVSCIASAPSAVQLSSSFHVQGKAYLDSGFTGSTFTLTSTSASMAAPMLINDETVSSLHQALGLNDIVHSIGQLTSLVKTSMKQKFSEKDSSKKSLKLDENTWRVNLKHLILTVIVMTNLSRMMTTKMQGLVMLSLKIKLLETLITPWPLC